MAADTAPSSTIRLLKKTDANRIVEPQKGRLVAATGACTPELL